MVARSKPLVQICLAYGRTGTVPLDDVSRLQEKLQEVSPLVALRLCVPEPEEAICKLRDKLTC